MPGEYSRLRILMRTEARLNHLVLVPPDGAVPGGREAAPDQDDLHELLRAERDPRDPLPEVPQHGAPPEGEGSPEGVVRPGGRNPWPSSTTPPPVAAFGGGDGSHRRVLVHSLHR